MSRLQSPKGTFDILPHLLAEQPWQSSAIWSSVEALLLEHCKRWGCSELRVPIFESTELFQKNTGESSDIVQKEMYTFEDKGARSMTLRPEGTPSALRALIDANAFQKQPINKVYYLGPMFRYDRPQQGRYRQFHQFGVEVLGPRSPWLDAELISLGWSVLQALGLSDTKLLINTLASEATRESYREQLRTYFEKYSDQLSEDSRRRLLLNPLRILDSKDEGDKRLVEHAPRLSQCLDDDSKAFFDQVLLLLEKANIPYQIDPKLVRGIDYYCDTVFEFQTSCLGAQSAIGGGGRYGRMVSDMGGPTIEGVGFALGMERLIQAALASGNLQAASHSCDCLMVAIGQESSHSLFQLAGQARASGARIETWPLFDPKKLKQALSYADKIAARTVAILGDDERVSGNIQLRDMLSRQEKTLSVADFLREISPRATSTENSV